MAMPVTRPHKNATVHVVGSQKRSTPPSSPGTNLSAVRTITSINVLKYGVSSFVAISTLGGALKAAAILCKA